VPGDLKVKGTTTPMVLMSVKESTVIDDNFAIIKLTHGMTAIVDPDDYEKLKAYHWQARKSFCRYYAMRKITTDHGECWIRMHREITFCPAGLIVHHVNRRTLDNRKCNLQIMSQQQHQAIHVNKMPRQIKYKGITHKPEKNAGIPTKKLTLAPTKRI